MSLPPCHRSPNPAFTDPDNASDRSIRAAVHMCQHCPRLAACARDALYAGESIDRHALLPADAVLQAGIICRGDQDTAQQLAQIAGVKPPKYHLHGTKNQAPDQCHNCHQPMVKWERNAQPPEGFVVHYARGFCQQCRSAYRVHLEQAGDRRRTKRVLVNGRPDNCKHCQRPMVPIGHAPGPGQVRHSKAGVCQECVDNGKTVVHVVDLTKTPATPPKPAQATPPSIPEIHPINNEKEHPMEQRLETLEMQLRARLEALENVEQLEQELERRLAALEARMSTTERPATPRKAKTSAKKETPEEAERRRAKERERYHRRMAAETPEQREQRLARQREEYQRRRARQQAEAS